MSWRLYQIRAEPVTVTAAVSVSGWLLELSSPMRSRPGYASAASQPDAMPIIPIPTPSSSGVYTVSGLYVTDQFTDNTVVYDYSGGVSHRTN